MSPSKMAGMEDGKPTWQFEVVHDIPGRIRIRSPLLKESARFSEGFADYFARQRGIVGVRINRTCGSAAVSYDCRVLRHNAALQALNTLSPARLRERPGNGRHLVNGSENVLPFVLSVAGFVLSLFRRLPRTPLMFLIGLAAGPTLRRAADALRKRKPTVDVLDAAALSVIAGRGDLVAAGFMIGLINLGEMIRDLTAQRSQRAMAELLSVHSETAWVLRRGRRVRVPVESIRRGDTVLVSTGESIPVDGKVLSGAALVNQQALTGESVPAEREEGDRVFACTLVQDGELAIEADLIGENTRAGRIVQVLREAPQRATKIEDYAGRFADRLVIPTFLLAGGIFASTRNLMRALSVIIIDFGTGIRVAAPTVVLSTMTQAVRQSILIKGGRSIEKLAAVDTVVFDKTGTLTGGTPQVVEIVALGRRSEEGILSLAAAAEAGLNHPAANAVVRHAEALGIHFGHREEFDYQVGCGVRALIKGRRVLVGNQRLLDLHHVNGGVSAELGDRLRSEGKTPMFVAVDGKLAGAIAYADPLRPESERVIRGLRQRGITEIHILTGDSEHAAGVVARGLDIRRCLHNVFPEEKLRVIQALKRAGRTVAVVGDGINDSPALAHADVAISFRQGADVAREAADVVLMNDDLSGLLKAIDLSRDAMRLIRQNIGLVAAPNGIAMVLAALGWLSPVAATLANNGTTVIVGLNGLRPLLSRNGKHPAQEFNENVIPR